MSGRLTAISQAAVSEDPRPDGLGDVQEGKTVSASSALPDYYRESQAEAVFARKARRVTELISADRLVISKMTTKDIDEVLAIERQSYQRRGQETLLRRTHFKPVRPLLHSPHRRHTCKLFRHVGVLWQTHITNIAVDPSSGARISERMLRFAFSKAKGTGGYQDDPRVELSNHGAQNLYRKLGFQDRGIRKGYYSDTNEDAIIMWKDDLGPESPRDEKSNG